jgi:hypothetical protein
MGGGGGVTGAEFKALIPDTGTVYIDGLPIESSDVEIDEAGDTLIMSPEEDEDEGEFESEEDEDDDE